MILVYKGLLEDNWEDVSCWEPEQAARSGDSCHVTKKTMESGRVCDCLLAVRAATMATPA